MIDRQTIARLLIVAAVTVSGCDEASRASSKSTVHKTALTRDVLAGTDSWHPHETVIGHVVLRRVVTLRAARAGRVTRCGATPGQNVTRGDVLLRLSGPKIEGPRRMLEDDRSILREQQIKADADMRRYSVLLEKGLISEDDKELIAARAIVRERAMAIDKTTHALEQLDAAATVTIPVDGKIVELLARDGSDVVGDDPLAVLSVSSDLAIEAAVFPMHGVRVRVGLRADVYLDAQGDPRALRVDYLVPRAEPNTGATIIGIFPGEDARRFRPGQRVRIDLLGEEMETVVVPDSAVVSRAGKAYCVKQSGDGWKAVEVTVVDSDGSGRTFLSNGLQPGDTVIAEGAYGVIYRDFRELFTFED